MAPPTVQTLQRLATETGYRLDTLEKVLRLLELLDEIGEDPVLSQRLALKDGTALNVFYLDLDRLSVGIDLSYVDLSYVGALDLAAMERERPEVDAAIDRLFASHGYGGHHQPTGQAERQVARALRVRTRWQQVAGTRLNYMTRQPLFGAIRVKSRTRASDRVPAPIPGSVYLCVTSTHQARPFRDEESGFSAPRHAV